MFIIISSYEHSVLFIYNRALYPSLRLMNCKINEFYIYLCIEYNFMSIVVSCLIIELINFKHFHIIYINSYHILYQFFFLSGLFITVLLHLVLINDINIITLEVNTYNYLALSLYFWLGYQLLLQRSNYYNNNTGFISKSNYTLINNKYILKNIIRRYLIYLL